MKKIIIIVLLLAVAGAIVWRSSNTIDNSSKDKNATTTDSVPTSQTVVLSNKLSEYKNDELGFAVKHPTVWEKTEAGNNVTFIIPIDSKEKNTVGNLEVKVDIFSGKCAFPLVTSVKERDTVKVGDLSFSMISIANTVQTRNFFNRMYSLQKDSICYFFSFSSLTTNPTSKGFTGADAQKVASTNTRLVDAADTQFKDMVKSFEFVTGPAGQDETKVAPKK